MQHLVVVVVELEHHLIPAILWFFFAVHEIERAHVTENTFRIELFRLQTQLLRSTRFLNAKGVCHDVR